MPDSPDNKGFGQGDAQLSRWAEDLFQPEDAILKEIRERSVRAGLPAIAVGRFDGLHLEVLARALGVRCRIVLEAADPGAGDTPLSGLKIASHKVCNARRSRTV